MTVTKDHLDQVVEILETKEDLSWFSMNQWGDRVSPEDLFDCGTTHCLWGSSAVLAGVNPDYDQVKFSWEIENKHLYERLFFMSWLSPGETALIYRSIQAGSPIFNLNGADLSYVNLIGADLSGADLSGADLRGVCLRGADLSGADLSGADLRGADLVGANLSGADLNDADLGDAILRDANLSESNLSGANLSGANLSDVIGLGDSNA